jgi:hypothetical protein
MANNRTLCDWDKKEIEKNLVELIPLVSKPKYICRKCGRVANEDILLCKGIRMKKAISG